MYRVKQLFGGSLTLRDYDGQVAEAMALVRALNKMTKAGMPERGPLGKRNLWSLPFLQHRF
ncbi:hypothetical protein KFW04_26285, partial [Klebsiella pneumoniae]|nr:hypothetical protein [Klebsiella pneumoniae]MCQ4187980.1 hypothetical protein [Klebsiella pneumoniae]